MAVDEHPHGEGLAVLLATSLGEQEYLTEGHEIWRDVGWSIAVSLGEKRLEIVFSRIGDGEWVLQVRPQSIPGLVGRLLGKTRSAEDVEVLALARSVHRTLQSQGGFSELRWCWDGFPDDSISSPEPPS